MKKAKNDDQEAIERHAVVLFGQPSTPIKEFSGVQGESGGVVRYFEATFGGNKKRFVAKHATLLERQVLNLLRLQGQAVPDFSCTFDETDRDWLVMEFLEAIPYGGNHMRVWADKLGQSLVKIHLANMNKRPSWLPALPKDNPLSLVYATEWEEKFRATVKTNSAFRKQYGALLPRLEKSWVDFQREVDKELADSEHLTLINPDFAPGHWLQKQDEIVFIDWETSCFGMLYFDLPNMFNEKTVRFYYKHLVQESVVIPPEVFAQKFSSLSRYLGFRFMVVGLDYWRNSLSENLPKNYWKKHGEEFFHICLEVAEHGYPKPVLDLP